MVACLLACATMLRAWISIAGCARAMPCLAPSICGELEDVVGALPDSKSMLQLVFVSTVTGITLPCRASFGREYLSVASSYSGEGVRIVCAERVADFCSSPV